MKLYIIAIGHKMPDWIERGFQEYSKRMPREAPVILIELKPENRSSRTVEQTLALERNAIQAAIPAHSKVIALDEHGHAWRTIELAQQLMRWQQDGQDVTFIIGGADGLHPDIKRQAHHLIQLSALTLPHGIVRVLLAEQLYRGYTIIHHHPYHRA
jgi:23S rRNA (pseudouridine1915-N3)-methyltransferase